MRVTSCAVPSGGVLSPYAAQDATYTDCFEARLTAQVSLARFLGAFYTTGLFRLERLALTLPLRRWIGDGELYDMAAGRSDEFAIWTVEARDSRQILLRERSGRTRSYLAVEAMDAGVTRLLFGSAVVPGHGQTLPGAVRFMGPLHRAYSRALLGLAARSLRRS